MRLLLLFFLFSTHLNAQNGPQIEWQKNYGGSGSEFFGNILPVKDSSGYVLAGSTGSHDQDVSHQFGWHDLWLVRLDENGEVLWEKTYGGSRVDHCVELCHNHSGGYLMAGTTESPDGDVEDHRGDFDIFILNVDQNGEVIWKKTLGGSGREWAESVQQTTDKGYIIAGFTSSTDGDIAFSHGGEDFWIIKLDSLGNVQWEETYGGSKNERAHGICVTNDGGYLVAGYSESDDGMVESDQWNGYSDYWVLKLDESGNIEWQRILGGSENDIAYAVAQSIDGNFLIGGHVFSSDGNITGHHGFDDAWFVKLDPLGEIIWKRTLGGVNGETLHNDGLIVPTDDGGAYVGLYSSSWDGHFGMNYGIYDVWLVKLDELGGIEWKKNYGGSDWDIIMDIQLTVENEIIFSGVTASNDYDVTQNYGGAYDLWVVKLNRFEPIPVDFTAPISLFPNPANDFLNVKADSSYLGNSYEISNLLGQIVLRGELLEELTSISIDQIESSTYFLRIQEMTFPFVKE